MGEKPPVSMHRHRLILHPFIEPINHMMKTLDAYNIQLYRSHIAFPLLLFPTTRRNSMWHSICLVTYKGSAHPWLGHMRSSGIHFPGVTTPVHGHASAPPYSSSHITHHCGSDHNQYAWLWAAPSAQLATLPGQNTFNPLISCLLILRSFMPGFSPFLLTLLFYILPEVWGVSDKKKDNLINH